MTSPRIVLSLSLAAFALTAAPAAADPVPLLASRTAQSVAVSGGDVIVSRSANGGVRVDRLPSQGGSPRRLLTLAPRGRRWNALTVVAASDRRVALIVAFDHVKKHSADPDHQQWQLYSGPPTGPLTLVERSGPAGFPPADVAVDGDRMFVAEANFTELFTRGRFFDAGAAPRELSWPGDVFPPVSPAGSHAAFIGTATQTTPSERAKLFVVDPASGAVQSRIDIDGTGTLYDLAPDGHVVAEGNRGLFTAGAGQPRRALSGGEFMTFPTFAGAAVAGFDRADAGTLTPAVVDPGAGQARAIGVPSFETFAIAADAETVAWIAHGCVLSSPVAGPTPQEPPAGPCPRSEASVDNFDTVMKGRRVRLVVRCVAAPASGCRGTVVVRHRGSNAGHKRFRVPSGRQRGITVRLSKRAAGFVRRRVRHGHDAILSSRTRVTDGGPVQSGIVFLDSARGA
jgi:hypothetical protein